MTNEQLYKVSEGNQRLTAQKVIDRNGLEAVELVYIPDTSDYRLKQINAIQNGIVIHARGRPIEKAVQDSEGNTFIQGYNAYVNLMPQLLDILPEDMASHFGRREDYMALAQRQTTGTGTGKAPIV